MFKNAFCPVVQDRLKFIWRCLRWRKPKIEVCFLKSDHAALVTGGSNLSRRLVGNGRKGIEILLAGNLPMIPDAGDQHILARLRGEFQDEVFRFLSFGQFAMLI